LRHSGDWPFNRHFAKIKIQFKKNSGRVDFFRLAIGRLLKEIGPTTARFPLKIQPLSFQWVVFSPTRPKPATLQKNAAETNALKLRRKSNGGLFDFL
jgi:hypothetical protein